MKKRGLFCWNIVKNGLLIEVKLRMKEKWFICGLNWIMENEENIFQSLYISIEEQELFDTIDLYAVFMNPNLWDMEYRKEVFKNENEKDLRDTIIHFRKSPIDVRSQHAIKEHFFHTFYYVFGEEVVADHWESRGVGKAFADELYMLCKDSPDVQRGE